ncbi:class I SAM-dependent methyltransferase [Paenibacillus sp. N1-5-1-14]|uniref:class I SAM-dependent methyltransferase n=1 Tax=Paenibacillus radicibacter TaxID=2972488 RepID=UPI00215976BC|nr:class I SAM-dependent methyltransferase [Paenibacillus radicibacter]MCR8641193.1 class I SAM-dependent methyltransferase [Paenibacillus radicibacter]
MSSILDMYNKNFPTHQNAVDIFPTEWVSKFPTQFGLTAGENPLFDDERLHWGMAELGGVTGKKVLELGSFEGAHSYMLEQRGAGSVLAIESNTSSYLKSLITKEVTNLRRVQIMCGDFIEYLRKTTETFDIIIASGVLYHMTNPLELLILMKQRCKKAYIWTHYYDEAHMHLHAPHALKNYSAAIPIAYEDYTFNYYRHSYNEALNMNIFLGGHEVYSHWMSRIDILSALYKTGFYNIRTNFEYPNRPNGLPSFAIVADCL